MATIITRPVTAEEFAAFVDRSENVGRYFELDEGEIIELPPPKPPHGFISANVALALGLYSRQRGRGYVFSNDTGVVVGRDPDTVRGPDVMLYDDDTPADDIVASQSYLETPPALSVEILSPGNRHGQIVRKGAQYLSAGVSLGWVSDPPAREGTVHRRETEPDVLG
ncbi:MAG: Uma2 family endonuclease, partial [Planctomycetota bacterium]|nr:Uma2 family endonuclease [Planctomycetota bacterium]